MATKLKGLRIKECSLVDVPANPGARVALFKRDDEGHEGMENMHSAEMPMSGRKKKPMKKEEAQGLLEKLRHYLGLDEESVAQDERTEKAAEGGNADSEVARKTQESNQPGGLNMADQTADLAKRLGELEKSVETLTKERDEARKEVETLKVAKADPKKAEEDMLKSLPAELRQRVEKAEAESRATAERLAKIEDERANDAFIAKAQAFKGIVKPEEFGPTLRKIAKTDAALAEAVEKALATANGQIEAARKQARAFDELGRSGGGDGTSAVEKVDAAARELMAKDAKLTEATARAQVWKSNPDLAKQYTEERRARH
jgi:hypothetical protein